MVKTVVPFNAQKWDLSKKENYKLRRSLTVKAKASLAVAAFLVCLTIVVVVVCVVPTYTKVDKEQEDERDYWLPDYLSSSRLGNYSEAVVSTDAAPCAAIGKDMLQRNGSAVDAAIAVMICMSAVNPHTSGLGGGFFMLVYNRSTESASFIDARETAPARSNETMFGGNHTLSQEGGLAIAVPGELAGYVYAHKTYGVLPWRDLFPPTIQLCRQGITVNAHLARSLKAYASKIKRYETISKVFINNETGEVYQEGDVFFRPDLAKTFEVVAEEGLQAVYGPSAMADDLLADLEAVGSIIDRDDMMSYAPKIRQPVRVRLRNNMTLISVSPPGGGALLSLMLGVLDGYKDMNPNVTRSENATVLALHRIVESFKFAYAKRMYMQDDESEYMEELVRNLTSRSFADEVREKIDDSRTFEDPRHYGGGSSFAQDHGTASMTVVAPNGDAVAVTTTVNLFFGSLVVSPSTGILLNDEMDDFSSPNITNYFGLPPTDKNHVHPGRRPMSSMTPTILVDQAGNVRLAVSGNGGTQITTSVAQTILRNVWLGNSIKRAIDAPRFHHQLLPDYIECEQNFPQDLVDRLEKLGHKVKRLEGKKMVGIVMGVTREDGQLHANSDYRKGGEVDGF